MPWIKIPVCYIEDNHIDFVYDLLGDKIDNEAKLVYIIKPHTFVKELKDFNGGDYTYFDCPSNAPDQIKTLYTFELNSTMAEELISLAITYALENIESQRLNSKLNMRGLEG